MKLKFLTLLCIASFIAVEISAQELSPSQQVIGVPPMINQSQNMPVRAITKNSTTTLVNANLSSAPATIQGQTASVRKLTRVNSNITVLTNSGISKSVPTVPVQARNVTPPDITNTRVSIQNLQNGSTQLKSESSLSDKVKKSIRLEKVKILKEISNF